MFTSTIKRLPVRLLTLMFAMLLFLTAVVSCGDKEEKNADETKAARFEETLNDPWYYTDDTPVEFDQPVSEFFQKDFGFEYEKAQAEAAARARAKAAQHSSSSGSTNYSVAELKAYAHDLVINTYGWSEHDFDCLVKL